MWRESRDKADSGDIAVWGVFIGQIRPVGRKARGRGTIEYSLRGYWGIVS